MAKTNWQDPKTSEIRSTHISGLQEAVGKLEESIGIETVSETNIPLSEVFISNDDRCRIYQAPESKRNWLLSPAPIIKKNDSIITDDFEIDYGGGAVIFTTPIQETDVVSVDATYTKKVEEKKLSTEDFTTEEKNKLKNIDEGANKTILSDNISSNDSTIAASSKAVKILNDKVNKKVDKVEGKGLSTNDYTNEEKIKNQTNAENISALGDYLVNLEYCELTSVATNVDSEGVYRNIEWKRKDGTLYAKSSLIGTYPYSQIKIDYYNELGTTIIKTIVWDLTYDENEFPYQRVVV